MRQKGGEKMGKEKVLLKDPELGRPI